MSKKYTIRKQAAVSLEPDGFSIHTFEISQKLSRSEYQNLKEKLYKDQKRHKNKNEKAWIYREEDGQHRRHVCTLYSEHGIRIILVHHKGDAFSNYYIRMIVNPRKLLDPESSYIGILPPSITSVDLINKAFRELFEGTYFQNCIDDYQLTRVDLCTNIRCSEKKIFRELVRVLRKLPAPPKYERRLYYHKDKKKANRYNKNYIQLHCGTHEVVIYDKTYHMEENNLVIAYEDLPNKVLRFEVHCEREYIRKIEKEAVYPKTIDVLWQMIQDSETLILKHFDRCFPNVRFFRYESIKERIKESKYKGKSRSQMLELAKNLQRSQSVDKALKKMELNDEAGADLLLKFTKLGISPVPLWKNFYAKEIPGPVELLRCVSDSTVSVEYVKVKYK